MTTKTLTLAEFVEESIHEIFIRIAEKVGNGEFDLTEEETAGVPLTIFTAEQKLIEAWRKIIEEV